MIRFGKQIAEDIRRSQKGKKSMSDDKEYVNGDSFEIWLKRKNKKVKY